MLQSPLTSQALVGRTIFVTGGAGAIGSAIVRVCKAHGAATAACDMRADDDVASVDSTNEAALAQAFDRAGTVTDIVHAVGALSVGAVQDTTLETFRATIDANLVSAFLVAREAARRLPDHGSLTFIASQAAYRGGANWGTYCASKAGVLRLAEALAQELGPRGIRINSVCPGMVKSPMASAAETRLAALENCDANTVYDRYVAGIPLGRYASPDEIAEVCAFLASPAATYISGAAIPVDGGEISA